MSAIPTTSFLLDGDMASVVVDAEHVDRGDQRLSSVRFVSDLNRPCDTCGGAGDGWWFWDGRYGVYPCPDCDGTGRHTFDIEVGHEHTGWTADKLGDCEGCAAEYYGEHRFRVHVIDVLPIHGWDYNGYDGRYVEQWLDNSHHIVTFDAVRQEHSRETITLPPDAAPDKWLVRLAVHQ